MPTTKQALKTLLIASVFISINAFSLPQAFSARKPTFLDAMKRGGRPRGPVRTVEVKPPMNEEIRYDTLRVSVPVYSKSDSGKAPKDENLGIMTKAEALMKAKELGGLDVILINENSDPPVVKIVEYSKFRYEKEKKAKELKKNSKASEVKEVKMSYKIDVHDYEVRISSASKFIKQGNRVKCTVQFKGREIQHDKLGFDLLKRMATDMDKLCTMDGQPKREGKTLSCFFSPLPEVTKAANDRKRAQEKAKKAIKKEAKSMKASKDGITVDAGLFDDDDDSDEEEYDDSDDELDDDADLDELIAGDETLDDLFN